jgi:hypothetical protein
MKFIRLLGSLVMLLAGIAQLRAAEQNSEAVSGPNAGEFQSPTLAGLEPEWTQGFRPLKEENRELQDLTLGNFFSAGWDDEFSRRVRPTGTPDYALLRVQTNFMEREFRVNYFYENNLHSKTRENLTNLDVFIAYAFNRRVMIEVLGNYEWVDGRGKSPDTDGGDPQLIGRVQLIDTLTSSYSFNFRAIAPNRGLGEKQTTFSYGLAGFEDLSARFNVNRVGLYYSFLFDTFAGPGEKGVRRNDVGYDITIAKTLTDPDFPIFGSFTVFVENFAQTDLDGDNSGHTNFTITPGVRFNLGKVAGVKLGLDNWILAGVDIPLAGPHPWDALYRVSYIKNF